MRLPAHSLLGALLTAALLGFCEVAYSNDETYNVQFNLGVVESWRVSREAILRWCEDVDPSGVNERKTAYQAWFAKNEGTIQQVNSHFQTIVPLLTRATNPSINVVDAVRAKITVEVLKLRFLGRSNDETLALCKGYSPDETPGERERVAKALAEINKWREANGK